MPWNLLIIEDDAAQAARVAELLEESPSTIRVSCLTTTLHEALQSESGSPDVILLDLELPDSSGLDTLRSVVAHFPSVPVVILTGTPDAGIGDRAIEAGADDYLVKGIISGAAIRRVVGRAAERNAYRRAVAERAAHNSAVAELGRLALSSAPLNALFDTACRVVARVLRVAHCAVLELTGERCLLIRAMPDYGSDTVSVDPVSLDENTAAAHALLTGAPVVVENVATDGRFSPHPLDEQLGTVALAAVPVSTKTSLPAGVLIVFTTAPRRFEEHAVAFLTAVSNILGAAIQRRRGEEALEASRRELQQILDASPDRVIRYDHNFCVTYVNKAAASVLPFDPVGKQIDDFGLPEPLSSRWKSVIERVCASGAVERFDIVSSYTDEHLDVAVVPVEYDGVPSAVVICRDITERLRVQARLETLFASNIVGVVFSTAGGVVTQANHAFLQIVGFTEADVQSRRLDLPALTPPHARLEQSQKLQEVLQRRVVHPYRTELLTRHGSRVPVLMASAVVEGTPEEIVSFVIDDTAARKTESLLKDQLMLLNGARDAIMLRDLEGRIQFWNDGATRLYGWTSDEAVGKPAFDLLYRGNDDAVRSAHRVALSHGNWHGELVQTRRDGSQIVVDSRWSVIHPLHSDVPLVLVINSDVTEKKSLERQLLHAQRLESLGTLAGGIAHDLNNILMPIMMGTEHLRRLGVPAAAAPTLSRMDLSTKRASELIRQMLTFARGHRAENEMSNPARLVDEVERILRETFPPSIEIRTEKPEELWSIACDPTQVHQVLLNLSVNARDAMPNGGTLSIGAANIQVDEQYARMNSDASPGMYVMLSVMDTGTGIPRNVIDKIFEPFYTTKEPGLGTGLGLANVRSIVRNHHGFLSVYSEPGQTVFKVYLPALHEALPEDNSAPPVHSGNGEMIIVIDDEEAIREITASTLQSYGYRVLTAGDGSEGVALYAQNPDTAVVVTDMLMPIMDGPTTIRALRRVNPHVRIIGMSGFTPRPQSAPAPNVLLQKPFRAAELLSAVHRLLSQ